MRGLTQKQVAVASQLPRTYISRIENGRIIPGLVTLERVAAALGVHLPMLLSDDDAPRCSHRAPVVYGKANGSVAGAFSGSNGNGNGNGFCLQASNGVGSSNGSGRQRDVDSCLQELLRYSGMLTPEQREMILSHVRELVPAATTASH